MKNLSSVFAAYLVAWAIFFGYYVTVGRRMAALRDEVGRLKGLLKRG
jgi:CcmD family protein